MDEAPPRNVTVAGAIKVKKDLLLQPAALAGIVAT
jgi:hypothetical protein